jgi:hypothetical protein
MRLALKIIGIMLLVLTGVLVYLLAQELWGLREIINDFNNQFGELIQIEEQEQNVSVYLYSITGGVLGALIALALLRLPRRGSTVEDRIINVDSETEQDDTETRRVNAEAYRKEIETFTASLGNSETSAQQILSKLAADFQAVAGTIYQSDSSAETLHLAGSYGQEIAEEHATFAVGEGLVGQVAKSNEFLAISDLPEIDSVAESGLGSAAPKALLVLPFGTPENAHGVIELGFFTMPNKNEMARLHSAMAALHNLSENTSIPLSKA